MKLFELLLLDKSTVSGFFFSEHIKVEKKVKH